MTRDEETTMDATGMGVGALGVRLTQVHAESARPWAPEVPESAYERRVAHRAARRAERVLQRAQAPVRVGTPRRVTAGVLHRLADAIAPAEPGGAHGAGRPVR
ncbi:hypothetical protein [Cellulomonas shaoxiangyii]|uniref:Uncharacterized protein n=1 Tax=Cellulomonas shaoxiangyii TaxID=2566013 RepID=A0A4P7SNI4_9CELL|nr:hypothetical protein [Cellulomonas shaoxiangyii]QCB94163.1 hypothetical protein E5225_11925 [Cellulomonas shaoxiangyii]TGY86656.1 hypothetical protein E5226_00885 [Cellulomonas shaoxiangyii]